MAQRGATKKGSEKKENISSRELEVSFSQPAPPAPGPRYIPRNYTAAQGGALIRICMQSTATVIFGIPADDVMNYIIAFSTLRSAQLKEKARKITSQT